ncbi:MAG: Ig-like domain-containing protein [Ignavibacteria bacterium]|nr:Ig-like domain-containing protein [Ignavibacteria bacterium]
MIKNIIIITLIILVAGCANQLSPGGGERDKIPPEITEYYPKDKTVNYNENVISLTFSEYVDQRSVKDAIFISPKINGEIEYNWSGKSLEIEFADTSLKPNSTYVVTIGTDITDINERNRMAEPLVFSFSTGAKIDEGKVSGKIYHDKPSGIMIYAFKLDSSDVNPLLNFPDNLTQAGEKGDYNIMGLKEGKYRLIAVKDEFRDFKYDIGSDMFGVLNNDILINELDTQSVSYDFLLSEEDTTVPEVVNLTMTDANHLIIEFSEPIDSSKLITDNFLIIDSTLNKKTDIRYLFKNKNKSSQYVLAFLDSIITDNDYHLFLSQITDKHENVKEEHSIRFTATEKPDTSKPRLLNISPLKINEFTMNETEFQISFDEALSLEDVNKSIFLQKNEDTYINISAEKIDDASFNIKIKEILESNTEYTFNINLRNLPDIAGNTTDTTLIRKLRTENELDYTGVSGKIAASERNIRVILESSDKKNKYENYADSSGIFNFDKIKPAKYILWAYEDKDSSKSFTYGKPYPFKPSEKFIFYPDTINVRARWPVVDVRLNFNK